jgi:hypothetical protein
VDGVAAYNAGAVRTINASLELEVGTHAVVVRAWDTSGAYGDQTLMLTVSSKPAVAVSMPAPGLNVGSPIPIQAFATPPSGDVISGWEIYVDGTPMYNAGAVSSISAGVPTKLGPAHSCGTSMGFSGSIWRPDAQCHCAMTFGLVEKKTVKAAGPVSRIRRALPVIQEDGG